MPSETPPISVKDFTQHPKVVACLTELRQQFGANAEKLVVSDVLDGDGHQYVHLVQKGGGVLGVALVGYTYILEQMGIRFIRLAGTSAGAINTSLMTVIGAMENPDKTPGAPKVLGDKKMAKSEDILKVLCQLNFFDLVDGHPVAKWLIKMFISNKDFTVKVKKWILAIAVLLVALPSLDFICLGLQHKVYWVSYFTKGFFVLTGFFLMLLTILGTYLYYLFSRLKESGFGINPGDFFHQWIADRMKENHVQTVTDLIEVASTPVAGLCLRDQQALRPDDLRGDVTFIASEIVTQNKIEFPAMWCLFKKDKDELDPAGFVRASMSIPVFFESYFINDIPCSDATIKKAWQPLGEQDPPEAARFVDGGILSNFPINLFFNPNVPKPRLPSFGIDLDDMKDPETYFAQYDAVTPIDPKTPEVNEGKNAEKWSFGGYLYRMFNTVRFYYDKDFLIKNEFFKKGIGVIPLKGYGWLNFFLKDQDKIDMFVLGARAATCFLKTFDWEDYKTGGVKLRDDMKKTAGIQS